MSVFNRKHTFVPNWELIRVKVFLFVIGTFRRMTIGVRAVMIDGDRVFLVRHTYISGWHFPGGGVEPGETAPVSLAREVHEETGYRLTAPPALLGVFLNSQGSDRDHVLAYVCRSFEKDFERKPDHEIAEAGWFDRHNLPPGTVNSTRQRLAEIFDGAPQSGTW